LRFWTQCLFDRGEVTHVDEIGLKSPAQKNFAQQSRRAVVGVDVGKNMIARCQRLKDCTSRSRSGGESGRSFSAFERADSFFQRLPIRIVVASVHESARV